MNDITTSTFSACVVTVAIATLNSLATAALPSNGASCVSHCLGCAIIVIVFINFCKIGQILRNHLEFLYALRCGFKAFFVVSVNSNICCSVWSTFNSVYFFNGWKFNGRFFFKWSRNDYVSHCYNLNAESQVSELSLILTLKFFSKCNLIIWCYSFWM